MLNPPTPLINTLTTNPIGSGSNEAKILKGPGAMPIHKAVTQNAVFSMGRNAYIRSNGKYPFNNGKAQPAYILKPLYAATLEKTGKPIQSSYSYSASSHIEAKKRNAIGQGSNVKPNKNYLFMKSDKNVVNSSLIKVRRAGGAAPPKCSFYVKR